MGEIDDRTRELERKRKNSNIRLVIIMLVGLAIFTGLFLNGVFVKEQSLEDAVIVLNREEEEVIKEDSLLRELRWVQSKLDKIKDASKTNPALAEKIENLDQQFNRSNVIPVYYYQRDQDGMRIIQVLENTDNPIYQTELVEVYDDEGERTVNTLYVGKNVNPVFVEQLIKDIKQQGITLKTAPYISARGTHWKDDCLEIGFERDPSKPNKNANTFVRLYSYQPDEANKIKKKIEGKLGAKGYQVRVFPDWQEKPSFFSDKNTILYYSAKNVDQANDMAGMLTRLTGLRFNTKMGAGLGVLEKDREKVFIIHYNGAKTNVGG